jgi:hypothetical protein
MLAKAKFALALSRTLRYTVSRGFLVHATVITIVNYNRNTFIAKARGFMIICCIGSAPLCLVGAMMFANGSSAELQIAGLVFTKIC